MEKSREMETATTLETFTAGQSTDKLEYLAGGGL